MKYAKCKKTECKKQKVKTRKTVWKWSKHKHTIVKWTTEGQKTDCDESNILVECKEWNTLEECNESNTLTEHNKESNIQRDRGAVK